MICIGIRRAITDIGGFKIRCMKDGLWEAYICWLLHSRLCPLMPGPHPALHPSPSCADSCTSRLLPNEFQSHSFLTPLCAFSSLDKSSHKAVVDPDGRYHSLPSGTRVLVPATRCRGKGRGIEAPVDLAPPPLIPCTQSYSEPQKVVQGHSAMPTLSPLLFAPNGVCVDVDR